MDPHRCRAGAESRMSGKQSRAVTQVDQAIVVIPGLNREHLSRPDIAQVNSTFDLGLYDVPVDFV